ncbi:hypothetical protein ACFV1L_08835 [Kitasatospora sp. NPDC059646]|uniref:hypothetical protein n=1 Tax=Kitasatospora sp. NPDC059646 TaxID=3346893 RepID=UPI0036C59802
MKGTAGIDELREQVARLADSTVEAVQIPSGGGGRFGLQLSVQRRLRWLWVHSVAWRLDGPEAVLAASGDDEELLAVDLAALIGRVVTSVDVRLPGWDTRIHFGDKVLTIFSVYHQDPSAAPDWTFRTPSGPLLVVGPGPQWAVVE